ncbi:MAG: hypothetical protein JRJ03_01315 [Deltaproteobacteria bacterium]|nr:hypothetical protein [Deltaproteobacteria bacterium]
MNGHLPKKSELEEFDATIRGLRQIPGYVYECYRSLPAASKPMDVIQASIPLLAMDDPDLGDESREANARTAMRLTARLPCLVTAWHRVRQGKDPLPPREKLSHAANFRWQLHGEEPDPEMAKDLDTRLVLHADHTFNASTFACREVFGNLNPFLSPSLL